MTTALTPPPFECPPAPESLRLDTERLVLRPVVDGDVEEMAEYRGQDEVCRFLPFAPQTPDDIRARMGRLFGATSLEGENAGVPLAVRRRSDDVLVGDVVLFHLDTHGTAEVGWVLHPDHTGRGYASEAVAALLSAAFTSYGLRRVVARIDAENTASARLAARVGMRLEAHLVENEWSKGRWADECDYAILAREWEARR